MQNQRLTLLRLNKQQKQLEKQPIKGVLVKRQGTFNFHFCLYELESPYKGGYYHGVLQLPESYPFSAPKLIFYTPSGRFQSNLPICTTFTNYHQQSWTSAWNVRTMILATISFMQSNQIGYGCKQASADARKKMAQQSLQKNLNNPLFVQLFSQKLKEIGIKIPEKQQQRIEIEPPINQESVDIRPLNNNQENRNNRRNTFIFIFCGAVVIGVLGYMILS